MPKFILLPMDNPADFAGLAPEEIQGIIQRYQAWSSKLRNGGHLLDSNKLRDAEGRVVRKVDGRTVVRDGPYTETKEVVGGYWLVQARNYDEVVELVQDCPHLEFGNLVIRQIEEL
ncbi:MAG: YciI family protein, partial [Pseudonocardiaceae bacterium]